MILFEGSIEDANNENHIEINFRDGVFYLDIENPWAGDTNTGFGYTAHISLEKEQAEKLSKYIDAHL